MKFTEIVNRLTGFSTPIFGMSWNPPEAERKTARRVLTYLEDRRVLYAPSEMEVPEHCLQSVLDIRKFLTSELGSLDEGSRLAESLKAMRSASWKFLALFDPQRGADILSFGAHHGHWASWEFNGALGELRGVFGVHIAQIAAQNGHSVDDNLAVILPAAEPEAN